METNNATTYLVRAKQSQKGRNAKGNECDSLTCLSQHKRTSGRNYEKMCSVTPTGFFTRNMFPAVSSISHKETTQSKMVNSAARSLSIRSPTRGEVENGRPNAAVKGQNQKSRWNSLHRGRNSLSDRLVMYVITKVQKPGLHDGTSSAYCCPSDCVGVSKTLGHNQIQVQGTFGIHHVAFAWLLVQGAFGIHHVGLHRFFFYLKSCSLAVAFFLTQTSKSTMEPLN